MKNKYKETNKKKKNFQKKFDDLKKKFDPVTTTSPTVNFVSDDVLPGPEGCCFKGNAVVSFCTLVDSKAVCEEAGYAWNVDCCN